MDGGLGEKKFDFWLSLHLNCTKILATQTFWELWPQNCARPVIKKSESGQKLCKGWSQLREQASIFSKKLQLSICTLPFRFAPCRTHCCEKVSILRNEVIGKLWTRTFQTQLYNLVIGPSSFYTAVQCAFYHLGSKEIHQIEQCNFQNHIDHEVCTKKLKILLKIQKFGK